MSSPTSAVMRNAGPYVKVRMSLRAALELLRLAEKNQYGLYPENSYRPLLRLGDEPAGSYLANLAIYVVNVNYFHELAVVNGGTPLWKIRGPDREGDTDSLFFRKVEEYRRKQGSNSNNNPELDILHIGVCDCVVNNDVQRALSLAELWANNICDVWISKGDLDSLRANRILSLDTKTEAYSFVTPPEKGSLVWAFAQLCSGKRIRRDYWPKGAYLSVDDSNGFRLHGSFSLKRPPVFFQEGKLFLDPTVLFDCEWRAC